MRARIRLSANPIIVKELRARMRGARAFAILTVVLLLLGGLSYAIYRVVSLTYAFGSPPLSPQIGESLFAGLALLELMAICFITPALTAGAISGEREAQTYEMLLTTPLNPTSILQGKLISALGYVFLLIFAAVPMASLVFTFGGVAPRDMLKVLAMLVAVAVTLGVLGIFMSSWLGRTGRATVLTYLLVLVMLFGTSFAYAFVGVLRQGVPPRWILVANPASALFSTFTGTPSDYGGMGLLGGLSMVLGGNLAFLVGVQDGRMVGVPRPLYHYTLVLYGAISLILYLLATRLVRPVRRWRVRRRELLGAAGLILLFGGAVAWAFGTTAHRYESAVGLWGAPTPAPAKPMPAPAIAVQEAVVVEIPPPVATESAPPTPTPAEPPTPTPIGILAPLATAPVNVQEVVTPTALSELTEADQAAIYAAVVRQIYTVDHTFGQAPNFPAIYLIAFTDDGVGDPNAPRAQPERVPSAVQKAVVAALADLPAEFTWVESREEVPLEQPGDRVPGGGAIVTVGNVHAQPDGTVWVSGSLYFASLGAGGKTYILQHVADEWRIVGSTGVEWIS